ncbi:MAG: hypothetical protein COA45_07595 [Zetaproteobacteria bacterium]|nr:MAG: hypothetical protein COA45_07595 [Zetaproteobacteria bacterium]
MPQIEADARVRIAKFIPKALATAIASYQSFSQRNMTKELSDFKKHQDACKVAIAHIQLLVKLAEWVELPDVLAKNAEPAEDMLGLMETAKEEIESYEKMT